MLQHMPVYSAALSALLFEKSTKMTLAVVFARCAHHMDSERVLKALVQHARVDLSARYPLVFGADKDEEEKGVGKLLLMQLEYVLAHCWATGRASTCAACAGFSRSTRCSSTARTRGLY